MRKLLKVGLRRLVAGSDETETTARAPGGRRAAVIAIAAQKGGVGKTTTAVSLATALARFHGKRVLLLDLDPQGHVALTLKSIMPAHGPSLAQVLQDEGPSEIMDAAVATGLTGLDVTAYDPALAATEELLGARIGKELVLRNKLTFTRTHYDVIVIDCPPNQGNLALNALVAADWVIIPCDPSPLAVKGVTALAMTVSTVAARLNPDMDLLGVLLTRVDRRNTALHDAMMRDIETAFGEVVLPVSIGISSSLPRAQHAGRDIFDFDAASRAAGQYRQLAEHILTVIR